MGTNESLKAPGDLPLQETDKTKTASMQEESPEVAESNEYFEQYKMQEPGIRSVNAWSDFYNTEDLLDVYLEKQGYPFQTHPEITDSAESNEYFEQYKMREQGLRSVQAWSDFYDAEDLLDFYLEKQGYPTN